MVPLPAELAPMPAPPTLTPPTTAGSLSAVPRLLRADPVLGALLGAADATVAVPEAAQAVAAAALAAFTERAPLLVVTPTGLDAERLADDLTCLLATEDGPAPRDDVGALSGAVSILPCLLYTSPSPRDGLLSRMPSSA